MSDKVSSIEVTYRCMNCGMEKKELKYFKTENGTPHLSAMIACPKCKTVIARRVVKNET